MSCIPSTVSAFCREVAALITTVKPIAAREYHRLLVNGEISAGVAIEDWTGVHFIGTEIHRVIAAKAGARAYSLRVVYGSVQEVPLPVQYLT